MSGLPDPLVPADADHSDMGFMPMPCSRLFISETYAHWLRHPRAGMAGMALWLASWGQIPAGTLPNDDDELRCLAGFGRDRRGWSRARGAALHGFILCSDLRLHHPILAATVADRRGWRLLQPSDGRGASRVLDVTEAEWKRLRLQVFERDGYACMYCSADDLPLECDHVVPWSRGGLSQPDNLLTACQPCNRKKGAMTPAEWEARHGI